MNWYIKKDYTNYPSQEWIKTQIEKARRCQKCQKPLSKVRKGHVNVAQREPVHVFCNRICKEEWIRKK